MTRTVVVGGGLAGLVAAREMVLHGEQVALLEASQRLGGQVTTECGGGFVVEHGAEGFLPGGETVLLCERLGLGGMLLAQCESRTLAWDGQRLEPLAPGAAARMLGMAIAPERLGQGLVALRDGMGSLVDALERLIRSTAEIRIGASVTAIRLGTTGCDLELQSGETIAAVSVVLGTPPRAAATLLAPFAPELAGLLGGIPLTSLVTVSLAYRRAQVAHDLTATGFVVPASASEGLRACSFNSTKFAGRAPAGSVLLRVFFRVDPSIIGQADDRWVTEAHRSIAVALGITGAPERSWVARWPHALPAYGPHHASAVATMGEQLRQQWPVRLAGALVGPGGIDGAIRSAIAATS